MKSTSILVALFAIYGLWGSPQTAEASSAYLIDETTAVFFLDFTFTSTNIEFGIPVAADHTVEYLDRVDVLGYKLTNELGETLEIDQVSDLVLSSAPLNDNRYTVSRGDQASFSLISVVTFAEPVTTNVSATITKLPYWIDGTRTTVHQNQLDELESVTTTI